MGFPIAGHLTKAAAGFSSADRVAFDGSRFSLVPSAAAGAAGSELLVWNRTQSVSTQHAQAYGSIPVARLDDLAQCSVIFSCLPSSKEVCQVADSLVPLLSSGSVWVDCTSGSPAKTRELAERMRRVRGLALLDAPVSGGPG